MKIGTQLARELLIDRIEWSIGDNGWWLRLGGTPVPPNVFILNSSLLDGADVLAF